MTANRMSPLAAQIEEFRERKGWSQVELSRRAGLAPSAVNDIVQNPERSPRLSTVQALAAALGAPLPRLLGLDPAEAMRSDDCEGLREIDAAEAEKMFPGIDLERLSGGGRPAGFALFRVVRAGLCAFGYAPGDLLVVRATGAGDSGQKVVARIAAAGREGLAVAYYAEPYLFRFRPDGQPAHGYAGERGGRIVGPIVAVLRLESAGMRADD